MSHPDIKKITSEVFKLLRKYDSVTPELYAETFVTLADELRIDLENIDTLEQSKVILHESALTLEKREEASKQNLEALKSTASQATQAMKDNDRQALQKTQDDIQALSEKIIKLQASVHNDELTGAKNRRWLFDDFLVAEKFTTKGTIAFVDLNHFKVINDTHGHVIGDKVLALVTHLLNQLDKLGRHVHIVRFGGDEFLVFAPETSLRVLDVEMRNIKKMLESKVVSVRDVSFKAGFSYGIDEYEAGQDFYQLLEKVDSLMYQAKAKDKAVGKDKETAS